MRESGAHARVGGKLGTLLWSVAWDKKKREIRDCLGFGRARILPSQIEYPRSWAGIAPWELGC